MSWVVYRYYEDISIWVHPLIRWECQSTVSIVDVPVDVDYCFPSMLWHCCLGDRKDVGVQPTGNLCHLSTEVLFGSSRGGRNKEELANSGSPGKMAVNAMVVDCNNSGRLLMVTYCRSSDLMRNGRRWSSVKFRLCSTSLSRGHRPATTSDKQQLIADNQWPVLSRKTEFRLGSTSWLWSLWSCLVSVWVIVAIFCLTVMHAAIEQI